MYISLLLIAVGTVYGFNFSLENPIWTPWLKPRVPGSDQHRAIQQHLVQFFTALNWTVEADRFTAQTPAGEMDFTNYVMTLNASATRHLTFAAHYDSKRIPEGFIGAVDSAASCVLLMQLAQNISSHANRLNLDRGVQILFFDGEEAVKEWSSVDSLYGSRHLVQQWSRNGTRLDQIELFVLLDLIGSDRPWPRFHDYFQATTKEHHQLVDIERRLYTDKHMFVPIKQERGYYRLRRMLIDDDHLPFMDHGVRVLHLIPHPFPQVNQCCD